MNNIDKGTVGGVTNKVSRQVNENPKDVLRTDETARDVSRSVDALSLHGLDVRTKKGKK
jgi:hypothetical protein